MAAILLGRPTSPQGKALEAAAVVGILTRDQIAADRAYRWKLAYELRRICRRRKRK